MAFELRSPSATGRPPVLIVGSAGRPWPSMVCPPESSTSSVWAVPAGVAPDGHRGRPPSREAGRP
jgi:hypothetical protein